MEGRGQIVEAMGGVWFDVPQDMNYDDIYQDLSIHQTAGYRLLSGEDAMEVLATATTTPRTATCGAIQTATWAASRPSRGC